METYGYENDLDAIFDKTEYIKFYPFIGKKYNEIYPKILVLGESHYIGLDPNNPVSITDKQLEEWDNDKYSSRYVFSDDYFPEIREDGTHPYHHIRCYRNTATMITGKDYHFSDYVWDYLSFYNFFQKNVGVGAKGKEFINEKLIEDSQKAYFKVINILKPELIIAWGRSSLYYAWVPQDDCEIINEECFLYKYKKYPGTIIWHISHPSQGFPYGEYHKEFKRITKETNIDISKLMESK